jgi:hypothetical protein
MDERNGMPTKRQAPSTSAIAAAVAGPCGWPADWVAEQLALAGERTAVLLRGLEAVRRIHAEAAQQAAERHAAAAGQLRGNRFEDVLALQADLLRGDVESAARYWQALADATLEMNAELWGCATKLVNTEDAFATATRLFHA